jgi:hypothetical protein
MVRPGTALTQLTDDLTNQGSNYMECIIYGEANSH